MGDVPPSTGKSDDVEGAGRPDTARRGGPPIDGAASDELLPLVYDELRRLAQQRLSHEGPGLTLQPTALVHEAYLRLANGEDLRWNGPGHFFAAAAQAMRRILVERARRTGSAKRGGARRRLRLEDADDEGGFTIGVDDLGEELVQLDDALQRLDKQDSRKSDVVTLRYFAGLSIDQTASALGVSAATVKNEWRFARAWLHSEMEHRHGTDA
jgi:RNA polymerase sigma factor (TIGR02999 family)